MTRLVLHFDVNETIVVEDIAGGDTFEDCLNKILAKNALVRRNPSSNGASSPMFWWDGTKIIPSSTSMVKENKHPPELFPGWDWPLGCEPYYKACKSKSKTFTTHDGAIYRSTLEEMRRHLAFPKDSIGSPFDGTTIDTRLTKDGGKTHFILPAFFECLYQLEQSRRDYTIVLRTFGTDLPLVADAIHAFAEGKHPLYPSFVNETIRLPKENMFRGRYHLNMQDLNGVRSGDWDDASSLVTSYQLHEWTNEGDDDLLGRVVAHDDMDILSILEQRSMGFGRSNDRYKIFGINDDYRIWSQNNHNPSFGKPIWVHRQENDTTCDPPPLHIFFDDNIKNNPTDSIVAVRYQSCRTEEKIFRTLSGEDIKTLYGRYLVRVPTYMPILQRTWFLQQIYACERNVANDRSHNSRINFVP